MKMLTAATAISTLLTTLVGLQLRVPLARGRHGVQRGTLRKE
ncbi:MAG: hypothetical protein ACRDTV_25840 [Mycobacterium sp.]